MKFTLDIDDVDQGDVDGETAQQGGADHWDTTAATIVQSRHRILEERLRENQVLVLQVPNPEPLRSVEPNMSVARQMHADATTAGCG